MAGYIGPRLKQLDLYRHGHLFIGVYEVNPREGADMRYGSEPDSGAYIARIVNPPKINSEHVPDMPRKFRFCIGRQPGDLLFDMDDENETTLRNSAKEISREIRQLEMPRPVMTALQKIMAEFHEAAMKSWSANPSENHVYHAFNEVDKWLIRIGAEPKKS